MKNHLRKLSALAVIAGISLCIYFYIRIFYFLEMDYGVVDKFLAGVLLVAETYMIIHSYGFIINIVGTDKAKDCTAPKKLRPGIGLVWQSCW